MAGAVVDAVESPAWRCAVCGAERAIRETLEWRCPNATDADRHHALGWAGPEPRLVMPMHANPFLAFRSMLAWDAYAAANGVAPSTRQELVEQLDDQIAVVCGVGLHVTPFCRADALSDALGFSSAGGVWVKDETGQVGGSHKARHLMTILLHLLTAESIGHVPWATPDARPSLAIASCGNAAIAAATLAAAVRWPIDVFVPPTADAAVLATLRSLGAHVLECPRLVGDPPGDPCIHRFREHVAGGAIPFTVQGTENVWCLDGGRTIGWEIAASCESSHLSLDRIFVQVGGGAFAAAVSAGLSAVSGTVALHAVQTTSCAPLERAWRRAQLLGEAPGAHWDELMWPWEHVGVSAADGILDDETYDWLPVLAALTSTGGDTLVATEADVLRAHALAITTTGINVSFTGAAGLAGLLAVRHSASNDRVGDDERVAVVFSGVQR